MLFLLACAPSADSGAQKPPDTDCPSQVWYLDLDGDGVGGAVASVACEAPGLAVETDGDCDDDRATVHPDADELCDGLDNDCDGAIDEGLPLVPAAPDADADGYGDADGLVDRCDVPEGWVEDASDCDDVDGAIHPDADELCDGLDNDCDGLVDDDDGPVVDPPTWYADADADTFGDPSVSTRRCAAPPGMVDNGDDCDDTEPGVHPGGVELCLDLLDQDCDGFLDDYTGECAPALPEPGGEAGCAEGVAPVAVEACVDGVATIRADGSTYPTVQDGVDAARPGEVVTVCPGVWSEALTLKRPITLVGFGAGVSVLSGDALGAGALQVDGPALTLVALTIHAYEEGLGALAGVDVCLADSSFGFNFAGYCGGVVSVGPGGSVEVDRSAFFGNTAGTCGGALSTGLHLSAFLVRDSLFQANGSSDQGGAVDLYGLDETTIENTWFLENTASHAGGALTFTGISGAAPLVLEDVLFDANSAGGGGAISEGSSAGAASYSFDRVTFSNNVASSAGGAFWLDSSSSGTIDDGSFVGNLAAGSGGAVSFGGWTTGGPLSFENVLFEANAAGVNGGALDLGSRDDDLTSCSGCTFSANIAYSDGGAVNLGSWGDVTFVATASSFVGNTAQDGGAISLGGGNDSVVVESSLFDDNVAAISGGAIAMNGSGSDTLLLSDCTLTSNVSASSGGVEPGAGGTITSVDTDWGTGGTDNVPADIGNWLFGAGADFVCIDSDCVEEGG